MDEHSCRRCSARYLLARIALACMVLLQSATGATAQTTADAFLCGYVTAVLEREFQIAPISVTADEGAVRIFLSEIETLDSERVRTIVSAVSGIRSVEVVIVDSEGAAVNAAGEAVPMPDVREQDQVGRVTTPEPSIQGEEATVFLPRGHLFEPLLAAPRWPRFAASYQNYFDDPELDNVAAVSLGGEFPLVRKRIPFDGRLQLGLHGGIFAIFDLDADSHDLVNADYRIGLPLTFRRGRISAMARIFHQSSHLGDEFLLRDRVERINLSYEAVELLGSYHPWRPLRLYGGGGYLFDQEPSDLDPWWAQTGIELTSPSTFVGNTVRPLVAMDLQFHDENDWHTDFSLHAGAQLESPRLVSQRIELLLEYYNGRNSNGQFFDRDTEYAGIGIQGHF